MKKNCIKILFVFTIIFISKTIFTQNDTELPNSSGQADYILLDSSEFPICVLEAKKNYFLLLLVKRNLENMHNLFIVAL